MCSHGRVAALSLCITPLRPPNHERCPDEPALAAVTHIQSVARAAFCSSLMARGRIASRASDATQSQSRPYVTDTAVALWSCSRPCANDATLKLRVARAVGRRWRGIPVQSPDRSSSISPRMSFWEARCGGVPCTPGSMIACWRPGPRANFLDVLKSTRYTPRATVPSCMVSTVSAEHMLCLVISYLQF